MEMTDGQYTARASLQINGQLVVRTVWRTRTIFVRSDPLAQTFSFIQNRVISAVGLQFAQRDPNIPATVQIRGVATGLPNDTVLAEKVIAPS
ncbi:hypothetical protein DSCO28_09870 [Desulfosarcina ovata subsp. sediminis]|uniref:Uncharacterized protein n=1 Tax=Desulfosarcina ovata subsp. sediminis TaxID=885957 RepID=A0A5K7ZHT2_9BACT|nr:hypothetical protein [Desulfosarcina ovata]BBO80421.1 hypothetical protein DSCO28_09870 [Desulfosarcina ovata subsp. sediminis]